TTTYQVPQQNQQETKTTQTQPANTQPQQPAQPPRPQTEWEKLGISEYAYYNTPMFSWEEKAYSNINDCINEANSINQKYGFVTNYGYVSGKYVDTIGCWVKVYVDGNKYYLGAFRALGY
ncbi:MAG: hypothetical protein Q4E39_00935, partial [bacterium]|nr:hypothetical protein [bacterium]